MEGQVQEWGEDREMVWCLGARGQMASTPAVLNTYTFEILLGRSWPFIP